MGKPLPVQPCLIHSRKSPCILNGCVFKSPWIPGTRVAGYFGHLVYEEVIPNPAIRWHRSRSWERGIQRALRALRTKCKRAGGNAVVALEVDLNPFHPDGTSIRAQGTGAKLELIRDTFLAA